MLGKLRSGVSSINDQISIDRREVYASFRYLRKCREYVSGVQDVTLTLDQQKMLEGVLGNDYCDNVSGQCLGEHGDRLTLENITAKQETPDDDTDTSSDTASKSVVKGQKEQEWIDTIWQRLKLDDVQQRVHHNLIRDGNYCLMVDYNVEDKKIVLHREPWWDGYTGVFIGYDTDGNKLYAVKEWDTPEGLRRTVYYEGAIERYVALGGGAVWSAFTYASDNTGYPVGPQKAGVDAVPIPYVDENGQAMHIPFVHFSDVGSRYENYGSPFMNGGKLGAQDQINDSQYDISAAARMTGYQRTWSKGYKLQKINNKTVRPKTGPGVHYHADEALAEWGAIPAGDISQLLGVYKMKTEAFCRNTRTPYASITGNWPSGEALYRLEKPITGATKARQKRNSGNWIEVIHRAIELANVYDHAGLDEDVMLTAVWTDAGDRDPISLQLANLSFWQAAQAAVDAGMPLETFLKVEGWGNEAIRGLTTDIIDSIKARQEELAALDPNINGTNNGNPSPGTGGGGTKPKAPSSQTTN